MFNGTLAGAWQPDGRDVKLWLHKSYRDYDSPSLLTTDITTRERGEQDDGALGRWLSNALLIDLQPRPKSARNLGYIQQFLQLAWGILTIRT